MSLNALFATKGKLFMGMSLALLTFFVPLAPLAIAVGVAIALDTFLGVIAAKKTGEKITSRKFSQAILKMLIYQCVLLGVFVIDKTILQGLMKNFFETELLATKVAALVLIYTELISANENIFKIFKVNLFDELKSMFGKMREMGGSDKLSRKL